MSPQEKDKAKVIFTLWVIALGGAILLAPLHEFGHWSLCKIYGGNPIVIDWFKEVSCHEISDISVKHPEAYYLYRFWGGGVVLFLVAFARPSMGSKWQWLFSSLTIIGISHGVNAIEETFFPVTGYAYITCVPELMEAYDLECKPELQAMNHIFMVMVGTAIGYFLLLRKHEHKLPKKTRSG